MFERSSVAGIGSSEAVCERDMQPLSMLACRDYLLSLTGDAALRMLGSPGKSGSVFFLSDDDR